jgi:hypothetical protein
MFLSKRHVKVELTLSKPMYKQAMEAYQKEKVPDENNILKTHRDLIITDKNNILITHELDIIPQLTYTRSIITLIGQFVARNGSPKNYHIAIYENGRLKKTKGDLEL